MARRPASRAKLLFVASLILCIPAEPDTPIYILLPDDDESSPSSVLNPSAPNTAYSWRFHIIVDMSVHTGVDLETGLVSEQSKLVGAGIHDDDMSGVCCTGCQPGIGDPEGVDVAAPGFVDTSEKARDLYPIWSEQYVDVLLERWKGNTESILLFAGLLSVAVLLFVIESYNVSLSPDVVDQALAFVNHVTSLHQPPPPALLLRPDAALLERSSSVVRATTLWLLSLSLNITCAVWVLWRQLKWWQQSIHLWGKCGESHSPARPCHHLFPEVITRFAENHRMVKANWVLLHTSVILFFVGLVDFLLLINKTITWILLGYLTPLTFLYAAATLLPCHFPNTLIT